MKKGIVAIFVVAILVALVGCVYVPPRQPTIMRDDGKEYPVYGVKYSIFSPADKILLIDGQEYVPMKGAEVGWNLPIDEEYIGYIDYGGEEPAHLVGVVEGYTNKFYFTMLSLNHGYVYRIKDSEPIPFAAQTIEELAYISNTRRKEFEDELQRAQNASKTHDKQLIEGLMNDIAKDEIRFIEGWGEWTDSTIDKDYQRIGTIFLRSLKYPLSDTVLLRLGDDGRYFVAHTFMGEPMKNVYISNEVAQQIIGLEE